MNRLDDVGRDALRNAAPEIIISFRGQPNRHRSSRKELRWGRNKGSLGLVIAGSKQGCWYDHDEGCGGDIIEFIQHELACSFAEALDYAAGFVSLSGRPTARPRAQQTCNENDDDDDERRIARALQTWSDTEPLDGTLAESYLRSRYIEVPNAALDVLRFHPQCPWETGTCPAMVGLVRDVLTNEPFGIHRTALKADGRKLERPKLLGPTAGGAIKLAGFGGGELTIAEGIETALSATLLGFGPAWSVLDAGGMTKFPVLPGIERLTIAVDHDLSGTGQRAAAKCEARWNAAGRKVRTVMSKTTGEDLNDILRQLSERGNGARTE